MKKLSLLFVACAFIVCAVAQKSAVNPNPKKANQVARKITATEHASSMFLPKPLGSNSKYMSTVLVGHSSNAYSSIISQCHQVFY